ncbi:MULTISPECIES: MltR family transcriptional regulator [unclassified Corallococcus]|uniref:MltR family transcriptional regulator n=1 Tax=unclassified Corallococcus TaxID=2685029 RepID=UPI001A8E20BE|nr:MULTISPECIES: MltR family transcriptional regulator [unclassified Corallococcus]MBN9687137.1 hypothetical protein [Corallococcus sp. NCSPR001]WAS89036.1 MltR family transcriptional regulator [Corallococcus sp. NCRR]
MANKDLDVIAKSVATETDRGCVLVFAAYIDEELGKVLRAFFIDDPKLADALLETEKPLGTFSARTKACLALGLISRKTFRAIELVRKTRNEFAHIKEEASFNSPSVRERLKELPLPLDPEHAKAAAKASLRDRFISCMISLAANIHTSLLLDSQRKERVLRGEN